MNHFFKAFTKLEEWNIQGMLLVTIQLHQKN